MSTPSNKVGRLVKASNEYYECLVPASQFGTPAFGDLVIAEISTDYKVYGLIGMINIQPREGVEKFAVVADSLTSDTIAEQQDSPARLGVIIVGYIEKGKVSHLVPPRPPMSLAGVSIASQQELVAFTSTRSYLRHILKARSTAGLPAIEILAAHISQAHEAHWAAGDKKWTAQAVVEIVTQLRDDYDNLMNFTQAISGLPANALLKGD